MSTAAPLAPLGVKGVHGEPLGASGSNTIFPAESMRRRYVGTKKVAEWSTVGGPRIVSYTRLAEPPPNWADLHAARHGGVEEPPQGMSQPQPKASYHEQVTSVPPRGAPPPVECRPEDRKAYWSTQAFARNCRFSVNAEFGTPVGMERQVVYHDDDIIRSPDWQPIGAFMGRKATTESPLSQYLEEHANYVGAEDLRASCRQGGASQYEAHSKFERSLANYKQMHKSRTESVYAQLQARSGREILDAQQIAQFFENADAVMYEALD